MTWLVGTDIGGTFTDIVAVEPRTGETRLAKVPSRPDAPVDAMLDAIQAVGLRATDVERFVHGTTRVTNAIVQDLLPPIALIATAGFEDVLEIGRYRRRDLYNLDIPPKAPPLVPHERCFGLAERLNQAGAVLLTPSDAELDRMVDWVAASGVQSVAVSLLHAYANPAHERLVAERLRGIVPYVSLSHEINPEAREYERTSSTTINAAAMPIAAGYLRWNSRSACRSGRACKCSTPPAAWSPPRPPSSALSSWRCPAPPPASPPRSRSPACFDLPRVLTFDMGGTTTDVCLIVDGDAAMTDTSQKGDRPLRTPMLAVQSIGAGGGSIVHQGAGGLGVGPQSAGVQPGPACYGNGGKLPTITDANAVLGYLDPEARLGSEIRIDTSTPLAPPSRPSPPALSLDIVQTALGIIQVANATMARALRRVTVERGVDGRDCALLAFGGGGPMHAAGLADIYGLDEIIVPAASSAFSALGCLTADQSFLHQQSVRLKLDGLDPADRWSSAWLTSAGPPWRRCSTPASPRWISSSATSPSSATRRRATPLRYRSPCPSTSPPCAPISRPSTISFTATRPPSPASSRASASKPGCPRPPRPPSRAPAPANGTAPASAASRGAIGVPTAIIARDGLDRICSPARPSSQMPGPPSWSRPSWQAAPAEGGHLRMTRVTL